jgi:hypothetical protein
MINCNKINESKNGGQQGGGLGQSGKRPWNENLPILVRF